MQPKVPAGLAFVENDAAVQALSKNTTLNTDDAGVVKVLFLTYSRSGSSFLGEVINKNKRGFYHFEPLAGVYSALYGLGEHEKSMSVFRYKNMSDR